MSISRSTLLAVLASGFLLGGCASLQGPPTGAGDHRRVEPLQGEGLELRMRVKLWIQNPNDLPLEYNGV
jgi:hypothetical protein